jgi:hypothetical protein
MNSNMPLRSVVPRKGRQPCRSKRALAGGKVAVSASVLFIGCNMGDPVIALITCRECNREMTELLLAGYKSAARGMPEAAANLSA